MAVEEQLNEEEQRVYDRQIRVWGVEAQRNLSRSKVVFVGPPTGVMAEMAKNLTLAGVGAVRVADGTPMAECPAGNFLVVAEQKAREGLTAAAACVETLSAMNPMVDVATVPPPPATAEALGEYTAVVATRLSAADASALAAACRASGVMLFVVDVRGGVGEALCDLGPEHTFSEAKKKTLPDNEVVTEWSNATLSYPSLASAFSGPWVGLHRKLSPAFGAMRAAQAAEAACSAQPGGLSAEKRGAEAAKAQAKALGFEREDVLEAAARVLAAAGIELPPVCAVVGGMVAQEVVKAVSKKGRPMAAQTMANAFFFDAFDQRGTYATVTPAL